MEKSGGTMNESQSVARVVISVADFVEVRSCITDVHRAHLKRWLFAGRRMGLHDGQIFYGRVPGEPPGPYIAIWVRENADPAYIVKPDGRRWSVADAVRNVPLGNFDRLEAALQFIRPVPTD